MRTSPEDHTTGPVGIHNTPNIKYTLFLTLHLGHCACFRVLQKSKFAKWNAIIDSLTLELKRKYDRVRMAIILTPHAGIHLMETALLV